MNKYDSVFADAKEEENEFEIMFDQEDDLIDTIVGCNENGDPLTGADPCPAATAEDRSSSDDNPDYEKDIDADDTKGTPKDAEGTVGYDFETTPEYNGKPDDQTVPEAEPVEGEDDYQDKEVTDKGVEDTVTGTIDNEKDVLEAYFAEAEDQLSGADTNSEKNAEERSCDDCNPDYEKKIDADDSKDAPKDAEGTVGYDFEDTPEYNGKPDDQTNVDPKDVKIDEEVDFEFDTTIPKDVEGTVGYDFEVNPEIGSKDDQSEVDAKDVKVEEEVDFDFTEAAVAGVDKDVEAMEDVEDYIDDDAIEDAEARDPSTSLKYDISDEEVIDYVMNQ